MRKFSYDSWLIQLVISCVKLEDFEFEGPGEGDEDDDVDTSEYKEDMKRRRRYCCPKLPGFLFFDLE